MKNFFFILLLSGFCPMLFGQDYLSAPKVNPSLFKQTEEKLKGSALESRLKSTATDDSVIYHFDTLDLPFRDDFSRNHLIKPFNPNNTTHTDTTFYRIKIGGSVYRDTLGLVVDSTFVFQIGGDGSIIQKTPQIEGFAELYDLSSYPPSSVVIEYYRPFNVYDTVNAGSDTIAVQPTLFQDSVKYYFVDVDSSVFYTDRDVLLNNTFPILPPSIGVVTFDGLDQNGLPYDIDNPRTVKADYLTSVPLRMGGLSDTNVYMSFYIQPQGRSIDPVDTEDSLVLDFYNPTTDKWVNLWGIINRKPDGSFLPNDIFQQVLVKVPNQFHQDGTKFRFRAYANSSGAFDQWHLDYINLNASRSLNDTVYRDITYIYPAHSFFKDFHAMPYWHFQDDPSAYMIDDSDTLWVKNNYDGAFNVFNKVTILDTINNGIHYRYPTTSSVSIVSAQEVFSFEYPIDFDYPSNQIDSAGILKAIYDIRFDAQQSGQDIFKTNDTVFSKGVLDNYYAYDDGTAEAGYGVRPNVGDDGTLRYLAVEFDQPFVDTIGGMQIYFLPQAFDIRNQRIRLKVWATSQSGGPGDLIFSKEDTYNPMYTDDNGFITLWFDSLVEVNQRYYIGYESVGKYSLNVGYDLNTNNRDRFFWSYDGATWNEPSPGIKDGSLMIRPIYRKSKWGVGIKEKNEKPLEWNVFPNPAKSEINIELPKEFDLRRIQLIDLSGRTLWESVHSSQRKVNIAAYSNGIYILKVINEQGVSAHKKIIISHE